MPECLFVSLYVCLHIYLKKHTSKLHETFLYCGHGSVLLWPQHNTSPVLWMTLRLPMIGQATPVESILSSSPGAALVTKANVCNCPGAWRDACRCLKVFSTTDCCHTRWMASCYIVRAHRRQFFPVRLMSVSVVDCLNVYVKAKGKHLNIYCDNTVRLSWLWTSWLCCISQGNVRQEIEAYLLQFCCKFILLFQSKII